MKHIIIQTKLDIVNILKIFAPGVAATVFASYFLFRGESLWWILLLLFGLFATYNWGKMLVKGSVSIGFVIVNEKLNIIYDYVKNIEAKKEAFLAGNNFTKTYHTNKISNFWRYTLDLQTKINSSNRVRNTDKLYFHYNDKKETIIDLTDFGAALKNEEYLKIESFLGKNLPKITLMNPNN